jgi:glycosyltransferase involved in cell wall biosynthesis
MITFIIPTIGRDTLQRSIQSIENQTNSQWKILIIFDGIQSTIDISNPNIKIIEIEKKGQGYNSAGNVRNHGIEYVDTEWIAFLDDDDTISSDFVETFYKELEEYPFIDLLIFRMYDFQKQRILPNEETKNFYEGEVGISFVVKKNIFEKIKFVPSHLEDFTYLNEVRDKKYVMMISPYVKYFVKGVDDKNKTTLLCERIIINGENNYELFTERETNYFNYLYLFIFFCFYFFIYVFFINYKKMYKVIKKK